MKTIYCTIRRLFVLFADYSYYSSTIRGLFVLFVDYSHYSLHYSSFINCPYTIASCENMFAYTKFSFSCRHIFNYLHRKCLNLKTSPCRHCLHADTVSQENTLISRSAFKVKSQKQTGHKNFLAIHFLLSILN
jgi:hypothetical protein